MGFVILAIIGIAFIVIITNISVVQQSRAYVIERLGAFHSVWGVGTTASTASFSCAAATRSCPACSWPPPR